MGVVIDPIRYIIPLFLQGVPLIKVIFPKPKIFKSVVVKLTKIDLFLQKTEQLLKWVGVEVTKIGLFIHKKSFHD